MDALSAILNDLRLEDAAHRQLALHGDWALEVAMPERALVYVVISGELHYHTDSGLRGRVSAGELILLPSGSRHRLSRRATPASSLTPLVPGDSRGESRDLVLGEGALHSRILCAWFRIEARAAPTLTAMLPELVHVQAQPHPPVWLLTGIHFIREELGGDQPGNAVILNRLMDIMLVQCVRYCLEQGQIQGLGWLAGLRDPALGRALALMHAEPQRPWKLTELAHRAGLSRSAFAARFRDRVGSPPMEYLYGLRMELAARILKLSPQLRMAEVAARAGYGSEQAFSRAFRDYHGVSPGRFRAAAVTEKPTEKPL